MSLGRSLLLALLVSAIVSAVFLFRFDRTDTKPAPDTSNRTAAAPVVPPGNPHSGPIANTDPLAVFDGLLNERREFTQTAALYQLAGSVTLPQLLALIDAAGRISLPGERSAATQILYTRFAELDPAMAVDHLLSRLDPGRDRWLAAVFRTWARMDLEAALAAAAELEPIYRQSAGRAILLSMEGMPRAVREEVAGKLGLSGRLDQIEFMAWRGRFSADPEQDWQAALENDNYQWRLQRLAMIAQNWARTDPLRVLAEADLLPSEHLRQIVIHQVLSAWGAQDVEAALDWLRSNTDAGSDGLLSAALTGLAQWEPERALALAQEFPLEVSADAQGGIIFQWASADPDAATAWVLQLSDEDLRRSLVFNIASMFGDQAPREALEWAKSLPSEVRADAASTVISTLARSEPRIAAEEALTSAPELLPQVVSTWARLNSTAALRWSRENLDESLLDTMEPHLIGEIAVRDPATARQAILRIPTAARRDDARVNAIHGVARRGDPAAVESLIGELFGEIVDPTRKREVAAWLYQRFSERYPEFADRYQADAQLPEVRQERVEARRQP